MALLALGAGCVTPSTRLDSQVVFEQLHKGQTEAQVRSLFGSPNQNFSGPGGKKLDVFRVHFPKGSRARTTSSATMEVRSLHVLYGADGRVEDFSYHVGEWQVTKPGNQQVQAGRWLGPDQMHQIKRGVTTREELVRKFGPATVEGLNVEGDRMMSWFYAQGQRGQELQVVLDRKSILRDYALREMQQ